MPGTPAKLHLPDGKAIFIDTEPVLYISEVYTDENDYERLYFEVLVHIRDEPIQIGCTVDEANEERSSDDQIDEEQLETELTKVRDRLATIWADGRLHE